MTKPRNGILQAAGLVLLVFSASTAAAQGSKPAESSRASQDMSQCSLTGKIFNQLAVRRDAGDSASEAVANVNRSISGEMVTGSHLQQDFRPAVESAVGLVYKRKDLNYRTLGMLGFRSCRLGQHFADSEVRRDYSIAQLLGAATRCQEQFPRKNDEVQLSQCMRERTDEIAEQVSRAQVAPATSTRGKTAR